MAVNSTGRPLVRRGTASVSAAALLIGVFGAGAPAAATPATESQNDHTVGQSVRGFTVKQTNVCAEPAVLPDSRFDSIPASQAFEVDRLHSIARGHGQTVAVLDSGVQPVSRLDHLRGGGDFVAGGDGLADCDAHGTLIAGIIGAAPSLDDDFVGVAPDAEIVSIRVVSAAYAEFDDNGRRVRPDTSATELANGIVRAADLGATVIAVPVNSCVPPDVAAGMSRLKDALRYAVDEKDALVVAAAGNLGQLDCVNDGGVKAAGSPDRRGWDSIKTASMPSYFADYVLSVGGIDSNGAAYANSLPGPWVDVAAPATGIVSLDPSGRIRGGLTNATMVRDEPVQLAGTSYSAAYVAGLAALIRETHPSLTARQVRSRIIETAIPAAQRLSNTTGFGTVNTVAALTADLPVSDYAIITPAEAPSPAEPEVTARNVTEKLSEPVILAAYTTSALLILAAAGTAVLRARRR